MTVFNDTYDTATPVGDSDSPTEADDRMREIKAAVQERLNVEHVFDLTGTEVSDADTGQHKGINCTSIANTGNETIGGNLAITGTLDVTGNIDPTTYETTNGGFLDEDDMASDAADKVASQQSIKAHVAAQITANLPASLTGTDDSTGETAIGELELKWGTFELSSTGVEAKTFEALGLTAFSNACFQVLAVLGEGDGNLNDSLVITLPATTGFSVQHGDHSGTDTYRFIALGR